MSSGTVAALLMVLAGSVGWSTARRFPRAANLERLRRLAKIVLASAIVSAGAAVAYVASSALAGPGFGWTGTVRALLLAAPALAVWVVTVPRTWVLIRGRASADPLSWVGPAMRAEVSSAAFTVPLAAAVAAGLLVLTTPAWLVALPYGIGALGMATVLLLVTAAVDASYRRRRDSVRDPAPARRAPVLVAAGR